MFSLKEIIENANLLYTIDLTQIEDKKKTNFQKRCTSLLIFGYNLTGVDLVKLTVGVLKKEFQNGFNKVQYCITEFEVY